MGGIFKILLLVVFGLLSSGMVFANGFVPDHKYMISYAKDIYKHKDVASIQNDLNNSKSEIADWQFYTNPHNYSSEFFRQPTGIWLTEGCNTPDYLRKILSNSKDKNPVFVIYFIPTKENNIATKKQMEDYLLQNIYLARVIGDRKVVIILEPDILYLSANNSKMSKINQQTIEKLVSIYKKYAPNSRIYLDAAHSDWFSPYKVSRILKFSGIDQADGFVTNVSNFQYTDNELKYAQRLAKILGNKTFIIDTSRNGNGPGKPRNQSLKWFDRIGLKPGIPPTVITSIDGLDAYFWVKPPGEADGLAFPAGSFHPELLGI